jgi:hypothetical protein
MALGKSVIKTVAHWVICRYEQDIEQKMLNATMAGYESRARRLAGDNPLLSASAVIRPPLWQKNMTIAEIEAAIKQINGWSDATNEND